MESSEHDADLAEAASHHKSHRLDAAAAAYRRALNRVPSDPMVHYRLGRVLHEAGLLEEAHGVVQAAVALDPAYAEAHGLLGRVRFDLRRAWGAVEAFHQAITLEPTDVESYHYLGLTFYRLGFRDASRQSFEMALKVNPKYLPAAWALELWLPQIYESEGDIDPAREHWERGLQRVATRMDLETPHGIDSAVAALSSFTHFYLAYQGRNDLILQRRFGALLNRIASARYPEAGRVMELRATDSRRLRVGFVSAHFRFHSIMKTHGRWVTSLDRERFEVHVFHITGLSDSTGMTEAIRSSADSYFCSTRVDLMVRAIEERRLDALIYLDIGLDARTYLPAALRLARVQCVAGGHPVTSGLATMDYFLSSELMEPPNGDAHYSETLVKLPHLGGSFPRPPVERGVAKQTGDSVVYLCSQSLFKLLPQYDFVFPEIASRVQNCEFWFLGGAMQPVAAVFQKRLKDTFARYGLSADRLCRIHPAMGYREFLALNQHADVFLDTMLWSGQNSGLEALACGLPIVTLPGRLMRSRHCYGLLARIGLTDTVAVDLEDYCKIAATLGSEGEYRRAISGTMRSAVDQVFDDAAPIEALGDFIERACHADEC